MGYNPNTAGGNYTQNSASYGVYDRTSATNNGNPIMGSTDGTNQSQLYLNNGGTDYPRINEGGSGGLSTAGNYQGFWVVSRTAISTNTLYRNNSSRGNEGTTSTGVTNVNLWVLTSNNNGSTSTVFNDQIAADFAGGALTSGDAANLSTYLNGYMTTVGANVY